MTQPYGNRRKRQEDQPKSLVTEKDIDPKFGLFTEEETINGHLTSAFEELNRLAPKPEERPERNKPV
ncbi:hypothetical protein [Paenibacillus protaetiae]|uniref:hypothetical protein n=1 Tax=Paenibacillus protaetiae TaxID=2509456 RepID=UPI0013EA8C28|nr:hypothetical protein [Paenibacillus protaetiae]